MCGLGLERAAGGLHATGMCFVLLAGLRDLAQLILSCMQAAAAAGAAVGGGRACGGGRDVGGACSSACRQCVAAGDVGMVEGVENCPVLGGLCTVTRLLGAYMRALTVPVCCTASQGRIASVWPAMCSACIPRPGCVHQLW